MAQPAWASHTGLPSLLCWACHWMKNHFYTLNGDLEDLKMLFTSPEKSLNLLPPPPDLTSQKKPVNPEKKYFLSHHSGGVCVALLCLFTFCVQYYNIILMYFVGIGNIHIQLLFNEHAPPHHTSCNIYIYIYICLYI